MRDTDADGGYSVILIDQHAADERVQLETLQRELLGVATSAAVGEGSVGGEGGRGGASASSAAAGLLTTSSSRIRSVALLPPLVMAVSKEEALMLSQFRDKMAR